MIHILNALFELIAVLIGGIVTGIANMIEMLVPPKNNTLYTASFGNPKSILKGDGQGFFIGTHYSCSLKQSQSHMICIGASSSKKSTAVGFPILLQNTSVSYIINDSSREYVNGSRGYLQSADYLTTVFDMDNPLESEKFNILALCTEQDIYLIAHIIVQNSLNESDYWSMSAEQIIVFFCRYVWLYAPEEKKHLPYVLELIKIFSYDAKRIDREIISTGNERLITEYKAIVVTPEKTLQSSLSTAKVAMRVYEMDNIVSICSRNTIDFDLFSKRKCALYLCSSANSSIYKTVTATLFEFYFSKILRQQPYQTGIVPCMLLIDECANIKLPNLSQALALLRKYQISIATFWQDYNQIENCYGKQEAANIYSNSNLKVFMPSNKPLESCLMLERVLGKYSYQTDPTSPIKTRELMTAQEIRELKDILVLSGIEKPLLIKPVQYFQVEKLRQRSLIPYKPNTQTEDSESASCNEEK